MADVTCGECGTDIDSTDDVEQETVQELDVTDSSDRPSGISGGVGQRDLFRCKACGTVLGVN